jgi:hypothetical protein
MVTKHEAELAIAIEHVARAKIIVSEQRQRIASLKAKGHAIDVHEKTLRMFELTLHSLEDHERLLREFVADERRPVPQRTRFS